MLFLVKDSHLKRQIGLIGASCLIASGVLGLIITIFFPMDPRHVALTFPGLMHLVLVGVLSILGIVTVFLFAIWFKKQADYSSYGTYSFISGIFILVTGGLAAASAIIESPIMGLAERLTIAAHFQWTTLVALKMYVTSR